MFTRMRLAFKAKKGRKRQFCLKSGFGYFYLDIDFYEIVLLSVITLTFNSVRPGSILEFWAYQ
jgi:hypothetical protein